ncbi:MAG: lysylphosphatidylglycerol synthase transmembrane domain-containing protein [Thermoleophilaceae bacterium]
MEPRSEAGVRDEVHPEAFEEDLEEDRRVSGMSAALTDRRRLALWVLLFAALVAAIYVLVPRIVGLDDEVAQIQDAAWYWVAIAIAFNVAAFASYVALFRGVLGGSAAEEVRTRLDVRASYQITMAGLAATRIFSAAGAGGVLLTYWTLRKAGMPRRRSACRMVAFLVLMYSVYALALVVFGVLLRTGVLPGDAPVAATIVPASLAGVALVVAGLVALVPGDLERRLAGLRDGGRAGRVAARLAPVPTTAATGIRTAIAYLRHPRRGALGIAGAVGFWAANIGVLWASFEAFGGDVPFGVLVQGYFLGMAANLLPSPAGGVGSVDAGMIGAFVVLGISGGIVFPAVLTYRVIAFWLPIVPGFLAFFQLRRTVARWEHERQPYTSESKVRAAEAT